MDFLYNYGPAIVGLIAAISIAIFCWNRFRTASVTILIWFSVALLIGQFVFFPEGNENQIDLLIRFLVFGTLAFGPAAILILFSLSSAKIKSRLEKISTADLVLTQTYRIGGVFLILAFFRGDLPAEIGLVSGFMDVTIAISAIALAIHLRRNGQNARGLVRAWASFSLLDFGWATIMKFADFFGVLELNPDPAMLGNPPLVIISLFALPLGIFISVHLLVRTQKPGNKLRG